jgi:hypothetical protein
LKPGDLGLWQNSYLVVVEVTLGHALWEVVATAGECCFLAIDAQVVHKVVTQKVVVGTKMWGLRKYGTAFVRRWLRIVVDQRQNVIHHVLNLRRPLLTKSRGPILLCLATYARVPL